MVRLTRAQQQERTRAAVLAAAGQEFAERGYTDAKVDRIAERAELTRGAVYSNFPSKRALYLAVLVDSIEPAGPAEGGAPTAAPTAAPTGAPTGGPAGGVAGGADRPAEAGLAEALSRFARARLERLPMIGDTSAGGKLRLRSLAGVFDDDPGRTTLAQAAKLEALLLALTLEAVAPRAGRRVRLAELVLTLLDGAGHLADTAPGFGDPFDVARACEHLAGLDLADTWDPPYLPFVPLADVVEEPWRPPASSRDEITGRQVGLDADGVVAVLGADRLEAAEEAVRAARPGDRITVAVVTSDPAETGRLIRLRVGDLIGCLRGVLAPDAWQGPHLVLDDGSAIASAAGLPDADDTTEAAVRVRAGEIVARARGRGAAYAAATAED
ncbi:TetR family transcriptional regulator [Nonomuraea sp. NPDC049714]|uniref:TetR family transcriptional regulator n=1 Tax=Nonomuraea sp. NPDC049714 TaxID=3364357 RepID=UPI0037ADE8E1